MKTAAALTTGSPGRLQPRVGQHFSSEGREAKPAVMVVAASCAVSYERLLSNVDSG